MVTKTTSAEVQNTHDKTIRVRVNGRTDDHDPENFLEVENPHYKPRPAKAKEGSASPAKAAAKTTADAATGAASQIDGAEGAGTGSSTDIGADEGAGEEADPNGGSAPAEGAAEPVTTKPVRAGKAVGAAPRKG